MGKELVIKRLSNNRFILRFRIDLNACKRGKIIRCTMIVHRTLGNGFQEMIYCPALTGFGTLSGLKKIKNTPVINKYYK
jgi:hypothetical protein